MVDRRFLYKYLQARRGEGGGIEKSLFGDLVRPEDTSAHVQICTASAVQFDGQLQLGVKGEEEEEPPGVFEDRGKSQSDGNVCQGPSAALIPQQLLLPQHYDCARFCPPPTNFNEVDDNAGETVKAPDN
ncbi:unnamed protein product [Pleuronectes platessa]|uniref:Uncharacterized protein n=1 Tax=Pleuronectes platessa TaxID=8262 RepID=A0A9N7VB33_PLEPL|nr:unnamed protein product [Pleuronectes platessa]